VISYREKTCEIGYWIGPPFWGTGHATMAARVLCQHLLRDQGLSALNASVLFDNPASQQVLRKAGFRHVGDTWLFSVARGQEIPAMSFRLEASDLVSPAP
jgi:RimJ/RimL family protein N-acetyltransferase